MLKQVILPRCLAVAVLGFLMASLSSHGFLVESSLGQVSAQRSDFVSDASFIVGTYVPSDRSHAPEKTTAAATAFLESLDVKLRAKCVGKLKTPVRREWTNLPAKRDADGVRMAELNETQIELACELMAKLFSEQGYEKMCSIMLADDQLLKGGRPRNGFGTENFSVVIFGTPSATEPWGFQLDGHHVGTNVSVEGDRLTMSPSFIGTQPHAFKIANKEYEPFKHETGLAHKLAMSLNVEQIKAAVLRPTRARIVTGPGNDGVIPPNEGLACSELSESQQAILFSLIEQWVGDLPKPHADARMKQINAELGEMKFAWNGSREPQSDVSYTIQSPSLIIEYACQNLGGNPLDHLHSNYRNPKNEYGGQLK